MKARYKVGDKCGYWEYPETLWKQIRSSGKTVKAIVTGIELVTMSEGTKFVEYIIKTEEGKIHKVHAYDIIAVEISRERLK